MTDLFREAGWPATPISLFGLLTIAAALLLAFKPERRFVPLLVAMGSLTFTSGALGLVSNIIEVLKVCAHFAPDAGERQIIMLGGIGEGLSSLVLAFALLIVAMMIAAAGAARVAMTRQPLAL